MMDSEKFDKWLEDQFADENEYADLEEHVHALQARIILIERAQTELILALREVMSAHISLMQEVRGIDPRNN
jgi:hypothetical protein